MKKICGLLIVAAVLVSMVSISSNVYASGARGAYDLVITEGNYQNGFYGKLLEKPLVVRVLDRKRKPVGGKIVTFKVRQGNRIEKKIKVKTKKDGYAKLKLRPERSKKTKNHKSKKVLVVASTPGAAAVYFTVTAVPPIDFTKVWSLKEAHPEIFIDGAYELTGLGIGDIDADNRKEIYLGVYSYTTFLTIMYIFEENGKGSYSLVWQHEGFQGALSHFESGDLNNNGNRVVIISTREGGYTEGPCSLHIVEANANNSFTVNQFLPEFSDPFSINAHLGDIDNDNIPELIMIKQDGLYILKNTSDSGGYNFETLPLYYASSMRAGFEFNQIDFIGVKDSDNDGKTEVLVSEITSDYWGTVTYGIAQHEYNPQENTFEKNIIYRWITDTWEVQIIPFLPYSIMISDFDSNNLNEFFVYGVEHNKEHSMLSSYYFMQPDGYSTPYYESNLEKAYTISADIAGLNCPGVLIAGSRYNLDNDELKARFDIISYNLEQNDYFPMYSGILEGYLSFSRLQVGDLNRDGLEDITCIATTDRDVENLSADLVILKRNPNPENEMVQGTATGTLKYQDVEEYTLQYGVPHQPVGYYLENCVISGIEDYRNMRLADPVYLYDGNLYKDSLGTQITLPVYSIGQIPADNADGYYYMMLNIPDVL